MTETYFTINDICKSIIVFEIANKKNKGQRSRSTF